MNKTVIVTGGAKGIGEAISKKFAENDYNLVINYKSSENKANELLNELLKINSNVKIFKADLSYSNQAKELIDFTIKQFGKIDILINNAGVSQQKLFIDITDEDWKNIINNNLSSAFYCSKYCLKNMIKNKSGKIINISSIWGETGASCEVHYSVSKAGIIGLTKALAKEVGPSNIQVNCVSAGIIKTDMLNNFTDEDLRLLCEETPLMKLGTPQDIANAVCFLASEKSDFITGQVLGVNGGFLI